MTRESRLRWLIAALVGVFVAVCLGFIALPRLVPAPDPVPVITMQDFDPTEVTRFQPSPPPAPVAQPVPERADLDPNALERLDAAQDRADWIDGATVTCDLAGLLPPPPGDDADFDWRSVFIDMDEGVHLDAAVDITSRFYTPIHDERISFTVTEQEGTARVIVPLFESSAEDRHMNAAPLRVRWSGAAPGTTVSCDGVWEEQKGRVELEITGIPPELMTEEGNWNTGQGMVPPVIRGCGIMLPMPLITGSMDLAAQRCVLQIERRSMTFPLIANKGEAVAIEIEPGQTTRVQLRLPDEPPLYQPPDLTELQTAADIAAYYGSDVVADALDELVEKLASGEWDAATMEELMREFRGEPIEEAIDEAVEDTGGP